MTINTGIIINILFLRLRRGSELSYFTKLVCGPTH